MNMPRVVAWDCPASRCAVHADGHLGMNGTCSLLCTLQKATKWPLVGVYVLTARSSPHLKRRQTLQSCLSSGGDPLWCGSLLAE